MFNKNISSAHWISFFAIYILSFLLIFSRSLDVQQWQWADDAMYFNNALAIIANLGKDLWLGPFTETLLSKAQMFPVFVAFSIGSGVPIRVAEFLVFAPLPFMFALAIRPLALPRLPILYLSMLCLLFIPMAGMELRLIRSTLFGAFVLYSLISLTGLLIHGSLKKNRRWIWAIISGIAIGLAAMTREEALWLFGPTLLVLCGIFFYTYRGKDFFVLIAATLLLVGYEIPINTFSMLNYESYHIYSPSLRQNTAYKNFYSLLVSLEPATHQKYVPINEKTRYRTYAVSSHFAELKPFLEGQATDNLAKNAGHHYLSGWGDKLEQREFFVSDFEFALAKAITMSGRTTAKDFILFCHDASEEIRVAIDKGEISSGSKGIGLLPPLNTSDYSNVIVATLKSIRLLFEAKGISRPYFATANPDLEIARRWQAYLGAWPSISKGHGLHISDIIYNKFIVPIFHILYIPTIVVGLLCLLFLIKKNQEKAFIYIFITLLGAGGLVSFSLVMGIVNTIAWPLLNWPQGYNALGQFPLHYLLLLSIVIIWSTVIEIRSTGDKLECE